MNTKRALVVSLGLALAWLVSSPLIEAGPRGGGGGRGGGGARGGGGGYRGGGAPMARPMPAARPNVGGGARPAQMPARGNVHGPYGGSVGGGAATRPPVTNRPGGGTAVGGSQGGSYTGPRGGTATGGSAGGIYTGPRGGVVVGGAAGGSYTGPRGNTVAGGKAGAAVIGPNGNVAAGGARGGAVVGADGRAAAGGARAGVVAGPGGAVAGGSRAGVATGPRGTVAGGSRGAAAVGPYGAVAGRSTVVAASGARGTRFYSGTTLANRGYNVRNNFGHYVCFTGNWYRRYPGAWFAAGWAASNAWNYWSWSSWAPYYGYAETVQPVYYDYGNTVTIQDGNVYYGSNVQATEAAYADQATQIATSAPAADDSQWQPLGVFAMVRGDEQESNDIFQFALNKAGTLRGNYYNATTDKVTPLTGGLDKKSQRVAWVIGDDKNTVFEVGLYNLTLEQTTILVHFGKDSTEQRVLVRIEKPEDQK